VSALLKSAGDEMVRPFAPAIEEPSVEVAADPRDLEYARLRGQIDDLQGRLVEAEAAKVEAVYAARAEGRRKGLDEAEAREEERLSVLRRGIDAAVEAWKARLDALDGLAAALANTALARIFEPHEDLSERVVRMLVRQVGELRRSSIVAIHVSRSDFANQDALEALGEQLARGDARIAIRVDPELETGACRVECKLEQVDLDVQAQWSKLALVLDEMAGGTTP